MLVAFSWSALWLRRILFFDFDVLRFGCAMGYLLCLTLVLRVAIRKLLLTIQEFIMISTVFQHF